MFPHLFTAFFTYDYHALIPDIYLVVPEFPVEY